jgi:RNA polymerase sigma-70 factor (ECF subfamily)
MRETRGTRPGRRRGNPLGGNGNGQASGDLGDSRLVRALARGDADALACAYRRHGACVHGLAVRLCGPRRAEDLTRAVFLSLWHCPGKFHPASGSLRALLLAETHRRAVVLMRTDTDRRAWEAGLPADAVEQMTLARGQGQAIRRLLAGLSEAERQVITLVYFGGYSRRQVATLLRLPAQEVNAHLLAGMTHLRTTLTVQGRSDPADVKLS